MAIPFAVFLDFGKLGLELFHELGLMKLALDERPHTEFNENNENNNRKTKIVDAVINQEEEVGNWTDNQKVDKTKHSEIIVTLLRGGWQL